MVEATPRWIQASDVIPMFPTLVWKISVNPDVRDVIGTKVIAVLEQLRGDLPSVEPGQGWQSEQALHERPEFAELVSCVRHAATSILRFLRIGYDAIEITGCWATVLAKGAAHKIHHHPNNFLSAVY